MEVQNAIIKKVTLGREDHGILTMYLSLEYANGGQWFGGYALDSYDRETRKRVGTAYGTQFILDLLDTIGVDEIQKMVGQPCRVKADWSSVAEIGHFNPKALAERMGPPA
jgi:hypothetical protein